VLKDPKRWEYYNKNDTSIDSTGAWMTAFIRLLRTAQVLQCIQQKGQISRGKHFTEQPRRLDQSWACQPTHQLQGCWSSSLFEAKKQQKSRLNNCGTHSATVDSSWNHRCLGTSYIKENLEGKKQVYIRAGCNNEAMFHFNDNSWWEKILTVS
jgi:hypothetical protein